MPAAVQRSCLLYLYVGQTVRSGGKARIRSAAYASCIYPKQVGRKEAVAGIHDG